MTTSTSEPEIRTVFVQIHAPSRRHEHGQTAEGRYIVADNTVTLTDRHGNPVRDDEGKTYVRKLGDGDNAHVIAGRLTKEFRLALRGKNKMSAGFGGQIKYPKLGIV
jgi:hypothetical protein